MTTKLKLTAIVLPEYVFSAPSIITQTPDNSGGGPIAPDPVAGALSRTSADGSSTPSFRLNVSNLVIGTSINVEVAFDSLYIDTPIITPYSAVSSDVSNGYVTVSFSSMPGGTRYARAQVNGGAWVPLNTSTFVVDSAPVAATLTQSSLTYEVNVATGKITFAPSCSDWAVGQQTIIQLSTSNTFPVGATTEIQSDTLTSAMILGMSTPDISFTRSAGTYYARHWRVDQFGAIAPYSDVITVTVPVDSTVNYLDSQISFIPFGNSVLANTFTVPAIPTGKKRYALVTFCGLGFTTSVPTMSAISVGGNTMAVTAAPHNSNSIQNYMYQGLIEIPTGTSISVTGTVSQAVSRGFIVIQSVTCSLGTTLTLNAAQTGAHSTALAVTASAGTVPSGGLVLGVTSEYCGGGTSTAGHTDTWTGGATTTDATAFDNATPASRIYMATASHGTAGGSTTATTTPGTVTINSHDLILAVLKAA